MTESGLCRLVGHKGPLTAVAFMPERGWCVKASRDSMLKVWELSTQHCFRPVPGHVSEVWGLLCLHRGDTLITGAGDSELRVWAVKDIKEEQPETAIKKLKQSGEREEAEERDESGLESGGD